MSKRILILLLIITIAVFTFCTKKSTTPEEQLLPPTNLTISLVENNKIQLTWTDNSTNEIKYIIDRKRGIEDWFNNYNEVSENITSFNDIIPTNSDTVYSYRLKAFDGEENSTYSDTIAWFSNNSAPKYLQIVQIAQDTLQLTWQDNSIGEQYFRIDRKIDEKGWQMNYAHVPADTTHFLDYTTALYDTCNYKIFAVSGISYSDSTESAFIPFLPAPTNLQLQELSPTQVMVTWQDNCNNEDGYRVYFKRGETSEWDSINIAENLEEYLDENVIPCIVNYYQVCAYCENNTSSYLYGEISTMHAPSKVTMTPHKCDPGDPGCAYTDRNNGIDAYPAGSLNYNWMKIQWDDTPLQKDGDIHHIEVWRFNEYGDTTFVEQIPFIPDSSTYYDKFIGYEEPVIQKTWSYFIIPFDEAGNSTNSDTVSYRLIEVPGLQAPINNGTFPVNESIDFSWVGLDYPYRILFYDMTHSLVYSEDLIPGETSFNISEIDFVPIPGYSYIWRIDAFFIVGEAVGSESEERLIHFTR